MASTPRRLARFRPDLPFVLLGLFLVVLWLAGGASREAVAGQVVVRTAAWAGIVIVVLFGRPRIDEAKGAAAFLSAAILLCAMQLIPLPPGAWQAMPGRTPFTNPLVSAPTLWRPWSLAPGATINALFSLVVPLAVLLLTTATSQEYRRRLPIVLLMVIALSLLVGLFQFTGAGIVNPLVNGTPGVVDGMLANRNHYALFLAFGLLITPACAFVDAAKSRRRAPAALGFVVLLVLAILATGSRAGIVLGGVALALGWVLARRGIASALRRYPRWTMPLLGIGLVAILATFILASVAADRAVSIDRFINGDAGQDMRSRALPTVLTIIRSLFPFGSGMGSFDQIFRIYEPFALLKPTYFNHAHNDFLEIVLTAGLPGLLLLATAIGWWGRMSVAAWRAGTGSDYLLPKMGSSMLLLILIASMFDYPARTPLIMAMAMIAAIWLDTARPRRGGPGEAPLP